MGLRTAAVVLLAIGVQWVAGEPELTVQPATELRFVAEKGKFYQLEELVGEEWKAYGAPVIGEGDEVLRIVPEGSADRHRVRTLGNQWVQVWADEFDGTELDHTKWGKEENGYGGGNNERQFYSVDPKYCEVRDGLLRLKAYRDPYTTVDGKTQPYSSARIRSLQRGDWTYGRFEVRAKVPGGEGIWPAVWMLPSEARYGGWAACGEIDILESRGSDVHMTFGTIHFGGKWPDNKHKGTTYEFPGRNAAEDFHVYKVEWLPDRVSWFVDDVKYQTLTSDQWFSGAAPNSATAPFDQPFHLILNLAVGGGNFFEGTGQNPDNLPDDAFPKIFEIDYVRVSQWAE